MPVSETSEPSHRFELNSLGVFEIGAGSVEFEVRAVDQFGNPLSHVSRVTFAAPAAEPVGKPTAGEEEHAWDLPQPGYAKTLEEHDVEVDRLGDLEVSVSYIRDGFHYAMARDLDRVPTRSGSSASLEPVLHDIYRKNQPFEDSRLFIVRWRLRRNDRVPRYYFFLPQFTRRIQSRPHSIASVGEFSAELKAQTWTVFDQKRANTFRQQLIPIADGLTFWVRTKAEGRPRKTADLVFGGIVHQEQRPNSAKDTIKPDDWQISCPDWRGLVTSLKVSFLEALPTPPPPSGFVELLERLETLPPPRRSKK